MRPGQPKTTKRPVADLVKLPGSAFPDDQGRQAHLGGQVAAALMAQAPELLAQPPAIEPVDVLAAKLPG
jgi:hypothetical protein